MSPTPEPSAVVVRDLMTTNFADYTVSESMLLMIFVFVVIVGVYLIFNRR